MQKWALLDIACEQVSRWAVDQGDVLSILDNAGHKRHTEARGNAGKVRTVCLVFFGCKVTIVRKRSQTGFGKHNQVARADVIICKERVNRISVALRAFPNDVPLDHV